VVRKKMSGSLATAVSADGVKELWMRATSLSDAMYVARWSNCGWCQHGS